MNRPLVLIAGFAFLTIPFVAETQTNKLVDTTSVQPAEVLALRIPSTKARTAANVAVLQASDLQNGHSPDLQDALNSVPGVYMETRGTGGSRRLQMRSSGLRSPYGVRNVLLLMDGFVLTNASGNSPLELCNPQWLHRLEVVKGPVGALYGNAYGGALIGTSLPSFHNLKNETNGYAVLRSPGAGAAGGGSQESGFSHTQKLDNRGDNALHVRMFWNESPGYRQQEHNRKNQAEAQWIHNGRPGVEQRTWLGWMDAEWGLPGGLNESDALLNPTEGPGAPYDAHVNRKRSWAGWSRTSQFERSRNGMWLYGQHSKKSNPFGTSPFFNGFKKENEDFVSMRLWRAQSKAVGTQGKLTLDQSFILRYEWLTLDEQDNAYASDALRYALESFTQSHWAGIGTRFEWKDKWQIDAQLAAENFNRSTDGIRRIIGDSTGIYAESYTAFEWLPFLQVAYQSTPKLRVFAQWGTGGSHPTSFELIDPEGYQPYNLQSEQAQALEIGATWSHVTESSTLDCSIQAYHQRVIGAIAQVPGPTDGIFMDNVEGLRMAGVEASTQMLYMIAHQATFLFNGWLNINRHAFDPFADVVPGTPLHSAGTAGALSHGAWTWRWQYHWFDRIKLHNSRDDWAASQHRLNASIERARGAHTVQVGVRNVLDANFSGWLQTNAFGGRYFNPAPPRSIWISWRWKLIE